VPVDMNTVENLVDFLIALSTRTQYRDAIAVPMERTGFLPNARIERDGEVFDDDQNA